MTQDIPPDQGSDSQQIVLMRELVRSCALQLRARRIPALNLDGLTPVNASPMRQLLNAAARSKRKVHALSNAVDTLADGFSIFDHQLRVLYVNKSFRNFFAPMLDVKIGTSIDAIIDVIGQGNLIRMSSATKASLLKQLADGDGLPRNVQTLNGRTYRWFLKYDENRHLISLASDITLEIQRQKELEEARFQAEQGARARAKFLTQISHELRTPLNGVIGMADMLRDAGLPADQQRLAEIIHSSAEALLSIINEVLDYAQAEREPPSLIQQPFNLETMAAEVLTLLSPQALAKGLDLRLPYDTLTPASFIGDPGRVRQVLLNLVGNAIKYTPSGTVTLRVIQSRGGLCFMVSDTGPGIEDEQIDTIFEEFLRLPEPGDDAGGTGLGLAITAQLVAAMNGRLWIHSQRGEGSTFGVCLPFAAVQDAVPRRCVPASPDGTGGAWILYICARRPVWRRMRQVLSMAHLGVRACADLAGAEEILRRGCKPGLVLYDDNRDMAEGLALRRRLAQIVPDIPCWILVNAAATLPPGHGFDRVITVPMARAQLISAVQQQVSPAPQAAQRQMRVLAVDDNSTNRLVIEKMLAACDIDLRSATNGLEAVQIWRDWRPDLVLMDILMPHMDGRTATRLIRQSEGVRAAGGTRIIAITANAAEEERAALLAAGLDDISTKPVRRDALLRLLAEHAPPAARPPLPSTSPARNDPPGTREGST